MHIFLIKMAAHNEINILCVYEYVFQIINIFKYRGFFRYISKLYFPNF